MVCFIAVIADSENSDEWPACVCISCVFFCLSCFETYDAFDSYDIYG